MFSTSVDELGKRFELEEREVRVTKGHKIYRSRKDFEIGILIESCPRIFQVVPSDADLWL
jgi:hypothetical protein